MTRGRFAAARNAAGYAAAIRERRKALKMTQKELALVSGLGRVAVLRLENDPDRCQLQTALAAAEALGLRVTVHDGDGLGGGDVEGYGTLPHERPAAGKRRR